MLKQFIRIILIVIIATFATALNLHAAIKTPLPLPDLNLANINLLNGLIAAAIGVFTIVYLWFQIKKIRIDIKIKWDDLKEKEKNGTS